MKPRPRFLSVVASSLFLALLLASGCGGSGSPAATVPSASATAPAVATGAPSRVEVVHAIRHLVSIKGHGFEIGGIGGLAITRDAQGRWQASAHLQPPGNASYWPANILIVKTGARWRIAWFKADESAYQGVDTAPTPGP